MATEANPSPAKRSVILLVLTAVLVSVAVVLVVVLSESFLGSGSPSTTAPVPPGSSRPRAGEAPWQLAAGRRLTVWWDTLPGTVQASTSPTGPDSNIHPADYVGPELCQVCHKANYQSWSSHPHRWMNALAGAATVKGDFSAGAVLSYRGGRATFDLRDGTYRMHLERGGQRRSYRITQTIGARFYQYYVGQQEEGPEPPDHHFYHKDHVLPFGYWLDQKEWVPVIHIGPERPDADRPDPFAPPDSGRHYAEYATSCNACHTTFPLGDMLGRRPHQVSEHVPAKLHWSVRPYLEKTRPEELPAVTRLANGITPENPMYAWDAPHYAATLGVSCEACHLGARAHVESRGKVPPRFFPSSPYLSVELDGADKLPDGGRNHDNVNWACGRCHVGNRPTFAAGMSTWNSVEYSDAMRGSCYSKLRCIDCHNPHQALGPKWSPPPARDDAVCVKCHGHLEPAERRQAHTHHPAGSEGARCLNCHMPRINEGIQDVVRTHMIYSPTRADMIQANHPNACNLCHTDRSIDWTLRYLKDWYGATYDEKQLAANYPDRSRAVALGWLASGNEAVRLVGADALTRARDLRALPLLLDALDDPYLVNRQFAAKELQEMLGLRLSDVGYRFYQSAEERRRPLADLRRNQLQGPGNRPR
jgi:predicted CXXCH cytochrome family protein